MKLNYLFIWVIGTLLCLQVRAQNYTLQGDTVMSKGIKYAKYTMTTPHPQLIHVLEIDLGDPTLKLQSVKSNNVIDGDTQTVKQMAAGKDNNGNYHNVIGAINGDFFSTSTFNPVNLMVLDGQLFTDKLSMSPLRTLFGIDENNNPFISKPEQSYSITKGGVNRTLHRVNGSRATNQLVLYNQYRGGSTGTNNQGTEVKLGLASGAVWKVNAPVQCVVLAKETSVGNMSFSAGEAVLSGNGTEATYLNGFNVGDAVTVNLTVENGVSAIMQVMGGFPRLVDNGENVAEDAVLDEGGTADQNTTPNPRTGVGISKDERTMYMVVVDGRNTNRFGMTMVEFGDLFRWLGAYNAVNMDGGGSSTMVVNNKVKNIPSGGYERGVGTTLLVYTRERLFDDFETSEGHFNRAPTYTVGTQYTVGIKVNSTLDRVTTNACSGTASMRAVLNDSTSISTPWTVRLLSGDGLPANNTVINSEGTLSFWLKTNTAQPGATVQVWFDDSDGAEASPPLTIINDGQWHQYNFDLSNFNGTTITTGNGQLDGATVTLDAIVLKQPNTASSWTVYYDDVNHDKAGSGTGIKSQNQVLDDFEANVGHFDEQPINSVGTNYTVGVLNTSSLTRITSNKFRGFGGLQATLIDDGSVSTPWTVRLLSGKGIPANNVTLTSDGVLSFWMKTSTAQPGATVQVWFDDSDGAEASPALAVNNDGDWHRYTFDLSNFNGSTVTTGNGQLDAVTVTLDAIVLKQPNTSTTWTVYFDDVAHMAQGASPGTTVARQLLTASPAPDLSEPVLYPNPVVNGQFIIDFKDRMGQQYEIEVLNNAGIRMLYKKVYGSIQTIQTGKWPTGVYVVRIKGQDYAATKKILYVRR